MHPTADSVVFFNTASGETVKNAVTSSCSGLSAWFDLCPHFISAQVTLELKLSFAKLKRHTLFMSSVQGWFAIFSKYLI